MRKVELGAALRFLEFPEVHALAVADSSCRIFYGASQRKKSKLRQPAQWSEWLLGSKSESGGTISSETTYLFLPAFAPNPGVAGAIAAGRALIPHSGGFACRKILQQRPS